MRVDLDAKVRTNECEDAGSIERVVIDPQTNDVTHFVVDTGGLLGRRVLVPREELERATPDGETLRLGLSKADFERLPAFQDTDYVAPPTGWAPPVGLTYPYGGVLWPAGVLPGVMYPTAGAMDATPTTGPASTGATVADSDAALAAGDSAATGHTQQGEPDQTALSKGAIVVDRNGDEVGIVENVRFDATSGHLRGFVLRVGGMLATFFGGGETVEVDRQDIDRVDTELVRLTVEKEALERAARSSAAR